LEERSENRFQNLITVPFQQAQKMDASPEASQENDQKTTEQKIGSEHKNHSNNWASHPETDGFQFHMWLKYINSGNYVLTTL
jgi:ABC-type Zn2+ transport system substrate-binding protein/surface adhesin